jgi:hypothetical protein
MRHIVPPKEILDKKTGKMKIKEGNNNIIDVHEAFAIHRLSMKNKLATNEADLGKS